MFTFNSISVQKDMRQMPICKNDVHCQQDEGDIVAKEKKIEKEEKEEKGWTRRIKEKECDQKFLE